MLRTLRFPAAATLSASLLLAPVRAVADDKDEAKKLFDQGRTAYKAEKYLDACPLFEESLKLDAALGTELNLALCWAKIGKLTDANKLLVAVLGKTTGPKEAQRHQIAQDASDDITKRMPHLAIERGNVPESATVKVDNVEVDISEPVAIDPGKHVVTADGSKPVTIRAIEGETAKVTLALVEVNIGSGSDAPPIDEPSSGGSSKLPYYIGGAGAGLVAISLVTGIVTLKKKSAGLDMCDEGQEPVVCTPDGQQKLDSARTWSHATTALFVVGAAGLGAGIYLYLKKPKPKADQPTVSAWATSDGGGFVVGSAW